MGNERGDIESMDGNVVLVYKCILIPSSNSPIALSCVNNFVSFTLFALEREERRRNRKRNSHGAHSAKRRSCAGERASRQKRRRPATGQVRLRLCKSADWDERWRSVAEDASILHCLASTNTADWKSVLTELMQDMCSLALRYRSVSLLSILKKKRKGKGRERKQFL